MSAVKLPAAELLVELFSLGSLEHVKHFLQWKKEQRVTVITTRTVIKTIEITYIYNALYSCGSLWLKQAQ